MLFLNRHRAIIKCVCFALSTSYVNCRCCFAIFQKTAKLHAPRMKCKKTINGINQGRIEIELLVTVITAAICKYGTYFDLKCDKFE